MCVFVSEKEKASDMAVHFFHISSVYAKKQMQ